MLALPEEAPMGPRLLGLFACVLGIALWLRPQEALDLHDRLSRVPVPLSVTYIRCLAVIALLVGGLLLALPAMKG